MKRPALKSLITCLPLLVLGACATPPKWSSAGGDREQGVVRLAYRYPEFHQPAMSEAQAESAALIRCSAWGFRKVEPIAGQIRECTNMEAGNCNVWMVTREFQCTDGGGRYASRLPR